MIKGLSDALNYVQDPANGFRALVLTGEGRGFCSGANLSEGPAEPGSRDTGAALETAYHPFLRKLRDLKMPLVTAVNGAAAGVGMSIALMGDIIMAGALGLFPAGLRAHRPGARWRIDLAVAAPRRSGPRAGAVAARREAAGRTGARMGPDQPRQR